MLFYPKFYHYPFIFLFFPFTLIYCFVVFVKFPRERENLGIPIISIGNIIVGGSGKTPLTIAIANSLKYRVAVVLRGYNRRSKGLVVVKNGDILVDETISGDEAMEISLLTNSIVIVSEDRKEGIIKAKELGAEVVILDDGFDKPFEKLNIVIDQKIKNPFCLPAGGYRYPRSFLKYADIVLDDIDREVICPDDAEILVSAISKPHRLLKFCKLSYKFFPDHYYFKKEDFIDIRDKVIASTMKDYVKLKKFNLNIRIIQLKVKLPKFLLNEIEEYLIEFHKKGI